ncbi:glycosyltransferase family 2 protein [Dactylosporangium sp. NPDC000521]|uniref:glycosyltransferase family 2 protein n=1 Tax=Dactylosporangium sp. NPDC000521 TaxID=3363975 RepID=UPI003691E0EC
MPDVTVVIATRNRSGLLGRTLERLAALPDRPAGVVVVDNASVDGTPAMVADRFPGVTVLPLRRNEGAVARNHGVRAARTPYVAFADDDSWWAPGALARCAALFDACPRLALIAARTLVGPQEHVDPMADVLAAAPLGVPEDLPGPAVLGFLACSAVVRRDAFLACGGFDPVVFFIGEEQRMAWDLYSAGWGLAYCADVVAHHHPAPSTVRQRHHKEMLAARNRALTAWMRRPVRVAAGMSAGLLRAAGADPVARRAVLQLLARLPAGLARRTAPRPSLEAVLERLDAPPPGTDDAPRAHRTPAAEPCRTRG